MSRPGPSAPGTVLPLVVIFFAVESATAQCGGTEDQVITAPDRSAADLFGHSVSVAGDVLVCGAPEDDDGGSEAGSAYVFRHNGLRWNFEAKLLASDASPADWFGISVATTGEVAVVGASRDADRGPDSGSVYVFRHAGAGLWSQEQKLVAADGGPFDNFGFSVAIGGNVIVIGAMEDDDAASGAGAAYVFSHDGARWVLDQKLVPADGTPYAWYGWSVAAGPDLAVVGSPFDDPRADGSGSVYVYRRDGHRWRHEGKLIPADGANSDCFGISVATDNLRVVGGAWSDDDLGNASGAAYVFSRGASAWNQEAKLRASDGANGDQLGTSVAIDGDLVAAGAHAADAGALDSGAAYTWRWNAGSWREEQKLRASSPGAYDFLGRTVSVSGSRVVVGAYLDDTPGRDTGSALAFTASELGLAVTPTRPRAGDILQMDVCRGRPGAPVLLAVVAVDGLPAWFSLTLGSFDGAGRFAVSAVVPSGLSGVIAELQAFGIAASDETLATNRRALEFQ